MTILSGIWVKVPPLVTVGPRCQVPCLPPELAIKAVAPVLQLGIEITPCQLSKVKSYVQLPGKYINVGSNIFLFE